MHAVLLRVAILGSRAIAEVVSGGGFDDGRFAVGLLFAGQHA